MKNTSVMLFYNPYTRNSLPEGLFRPKPQICHTATHGARGPYPGPQLLSRL